MPLAADDRSACRCAYSRCDPRGYEPDPAIVAEAKRVARETRGKIEILRSAEDAVAGAQAIYTDVWASMGQEEESAAREIAFRLPTR